jgi:hypothetical protein
MGSYDFKEIKIKDFLFMNKLCIYIVQFIIYKLLMLFYLREIGTRFAN